MLDLAPKPLPDNGLRRAVLWAERMNNVRVWKWGIKGSKKERLAVSYAWMANEQCKIGPS